MKKKFNLFVLFLFLFLFLSSFSLSYAACVPDGLTGCNVGKAGTNTNCCNPNSDCDYAYGGYTTSCVPPPTPTVLPTPTDSPGACPGTVGSGCDSAPCCWSAGFVCVPGHGSEGRGASCQKCSGGHNDSCTPGDYSNPSQCCTTGLSCAIAPGTEASKCLYPYEFQNLPTVNLQNPCPSGYCPTAIGNIPTDVSGFIAKLFQVILSLAGGGALIMIVYAGYRLSLSQGNPEKVQQAREILTSAIVGLLFIIFSVTILQIIGVDVLGLPGFSK